MFKAALSVLALACATAANAGVTITYPSTTSIPTSNNFKADLALLGLTQYAASGSNIVLDSDSTITFYFLGSESGFDDTFKTTNALPNLTTTEHTTIVNNFSAPVLIGSDAFSAGTLINNLLFTNNGGSSGQDATVGDPGFGIFLGRGDSSGLDTNTFYFGYDDQKNDPDRDYDDFIVKAVVTPLPEPGTWALMLLGFGAIGFAARRKSSAGIPQIA